MLGHLVDQAKLRATIAATHYGGRAVVAALFFVAVVFGLAAVFILIAKQAGAIVACVTMAVAFLILAIVIAMVMISRERTQRLAMRQAARNSAMTAGVASVVPALFASGRRMASRSKLSMPLVVGSALLVAMLSLRSRSEEDASHPR